MEAAFVDHIDDEALVTGNHDGADGAGALSDKDADFKSCGVVVGSAIYNDTQGTNGLITAVTEGSITDDTNSWDRGDAFSIYKTAAKNTRLSVIATDMSRGWKVTHEWELTEAGWFPRDVDQDDKAAYPDTDQDATSDVYFADDDVAWGDGFHKES